MTASYLQQSNERRLEPNYDGPLLLWDIDKTYLNTRFSSLRGLAAIPFEFAIDKEAIPGVVPLIRALRHGPDVSSAITPLYFISGSPPQLRTVVEKKMTLDGVDFDGITFKDQWGLVRSGRVRDVRKQVGYKLKALLLYRQVVSDGARWLMFGDDVEDDANVFLLFGETCAGLRGIALQQRLAHHHVHPQDQAEILNLCESIPISRDPVALVCIRQVRHRPLEASDPRVFATPNYLATALLCAHRGFIRPQAVAAVARGMRRRGMPDAQVSAAIEYAREHFGAPDALVDLAK